MKFGMMDNWTKYNVCRYAVFLKLKKETLGGPNV